MLPVQNKLAFPGVRSFAMKISIYWLFVNFRFPDFQSFKFLMKSFLQVCHSVEPKVFVKHSPGPGYFICKIICTYLKSSTERKSYLEKKAIYGQREKLVTLAPLLTGSRKIDHFFVLLPLRLLRLRQTAFKEIARLFI